MKRSRLQASLDPYNDPMQPADPREILPSPEEEDRRQQQSILLAILSGLDPSGMQPPSQQAMGGM